MNVSRLEEVIRDACLLEATARKAGNVHPEASFKHLCYTDFVRSAHAIAPILARTGERGVGRTILRAVEATRSVCDHNTNLGIILLLTPLAGVRSDIPLREGIAGVLSGLTVVDSKKVFQAVRLAAPRGLGQSDTEDVAAEPTQPLIEIMRLATDRDLIARQFSTDFEMVLRFSESCLSPEAMAADWETQVIRLQLELMASTPETDILRKCGEAEAIEASRRARNVLDSGWPESQAAQTQFAEFDAWLREDGSRRNPGTTADLVTACLFVALREGRIRMPAQFEADIQPAN
jgi:triphosphoribosyl-dephospho-CoA synthase